MALNFLLKRSGTASKRPVAASMALGEVDINYDASTGGLFYKDSAGSVVKVGPAEVGSAAPNATPAGSSGNSAGEFWYDTGTSSLKMWDGTSWVSTGGSGGSGTVTDITAGTGLTGGTITTSGTIALDSACVIAPSLLTTTGDTIYASAANTPSRLAIGTAGQVLTVSGGVPAWVTPLLGVTNSLTPFNTALGFCAGAAWTSANLRNIAIGYCALDADASGDDNIALGFNSLGSNNGGGFNVVIGSCAGCSMTSGNSNVFIGNTAARAVTASTNNVVIGSGAGTNLAGNSNVLIGTSAIGTGAAVAGNVAIGCGAGSISAGSDNTYVGCRAGDASSNTSFNVALGANALGGAHQQCGTVAIGTEALLVSTTGIGNVAVGYQAGDAVSTGGGNTLVGYTAGDAITTGSNNTVIGDIAGSTALTGNLILGAGTTIKLQVNENGAVGVGSTPSYGTTNQVLTSGGTGAAPTWTSPTWVNASRVTTTSTDVTQILGLNSATRRGATFNLAVVDTVGGSYWIDIWTVIHDGTNATLTLTASGAHIGASPYTLNAVVLPGVISIQATSASANSTTYDIAVQLFSI